MIFKQLNPYACQTYSLGNENDNTVVLVDPVIDHFQDYLARLLKENLKLTYVIDTHTHADHISAGPALRDATECEYIMHENAPSKWVSLRVKEGDVLNLNGFRFKVMHTPGHTKDSISLIVDDKFLTGDFLFLDEAGAGRDDLPGGSPVDHWESLNRLPDLPDNLMVYPAHEYQNRQSSTLGSQRQRNPHLRKRTKNEFVKYIEDFQLGLAEWIKDMMKANYAGAKDPNTAGIPTDTPAWEIQEATGISLNERTVRYVSAPELKQMLQAGGPPVLIDVREAYELASNLGHIDGVINIPLGSLMNRLSELQGYKTKNVVVICRSGARAATGAQILLQAGFGNVAVLEGGMLSWRMNNF